MSPAPIVKKDPPDWSMPVGVPAGEPGCVPGALAAEKLKDGTPAAIPEGGVGAFMTPPPPNTNGCEEPVFVEPEPKENDGGLLTCDVLEEPKLKPGALPLTLPEAPLACAPNENDGVLPFVVLWPKAVVG